MIKKSSSAGTGGELVAKAEVCRKEGARGAQQAPVLPTAPPVLGAIEAVIASFHAAPR